METDALMVEIAKLESNPKQPLPIPSLQVQVPVHKLYKDEPQEVPKVLKANVAAIPPVSTVIPSAPAPAAAKKNVTKGKFLHSTVLNRCFKWLAYSNKSYP